MSDSINCLRCDTPMNQGFIADVDRGGYNQMLWVPGAPDDSAFRGLKVKLATAMTVSTMRCPQCGALESFAW